MAKRPQDDIRRWAIMGAEARLVQLAEEAAAIHRAFPELRQRGTRRGRPAASADSEFQARPRRRRRRKMSAEARKRISEAQKARWAKRKAHGAAGGGPKKK
jgi:hypothetical protein